MVDSSKLPPSHAPKPAQNPAVPGEQSGRVVTLPDSMEVVARARRLEGEVVRQNADGSTRIKTPEGNIDVQLRGKQPQPGTQVQVDIPAGRPPRQVTVRPAPDAPPAPPPQTPAAPPPVTAAPRPVIPVQPIQTPQAQTPAPAGGPPPATVTPVPPASSSPPAQAPAAPLPVPASPLPPPVSVTPKPLPGVPAQTPLPLPPVTNTNLPPPALSPLPDNTVVRLTPLQPAQAQSLLQQSAAPTLPSATTTITTAAFSANLVAQGTQDGLIQQLVNLVRPAIMATPPPAPLLTAPAQLPAAPVPGAAFASQPATAGAGISQPGLFNSAPMPTIAPALSASPGIALPPATVTPAVFPLTPDAAIAPKTLAMLDVLVTKITLPAPALTPPPGQPALPAAAAAAPLVQTSVSQSPQAQAATLTATVIGTTPQGQPVVTFPAPAGATPQAFILQFPASNLPIGAQLQIIPQSGQAMPALPGASAAPPIPAAVPVNPAAHSLPLLMGSRWPVLAEMMQTLQQSAPDLAQALARALPSPASPRAIPPAALLFIAAAKAGDLAAWLGDKKTEALQRLGRAGLLGRLTGEGQQINRLSSEPLPGTDWRAVPLPMFWESEIHKVALYFKRDGDNPGRDAQDGEQTRFIFDLSLSRMGDVQIDGLMRGQRLDLIVRSQSPFSQPMMAHMKQLYNAAIEDVALTGDLSFQGDPRSWVKVLPQEKTYLANI